MTLKEKIVNDINDVGHFVFDVETDSLNIIEANLVGVSVCFDFETAYYIPLQHKDALNAVIQEQILMKDFMNEMKSLMQEESIIKIGHNIKYDISILKKYDLEVKSYEDTMLMSYSCDAGVNRHGMDELARIHLNRETIKFKDVVGSGKSQLTFDQVDLKRATEYAAEDAEITYKLYRFFKKRVQQENNSLVYSTIERPLVDCLVRMEINGIKAVSYTHLTLPPSDLV